MKETVEQFKTQVNDSRPESTATKMIKGFHSLLSKARELKLGGEQVKLPEPVVNQK